MKYFIRREADHYTIFAMRKGARQLLSLDKRLYDVHDERFYRDPKTSDAYVMYDIDCSQPFGHEPVYLNTEMTRVEIISSNISGTKKDRFFHLDGSKIEKYLGTVVVVGALLYWVLTGGLGGLF